MNVRLPLFLILLTACGPVAVQAPQATWTDPSGLSGVDDVADVPTGVDDAVADASRVAAHLSLSAERAAVAIDNAPSPSPLVQAVADVVRHIHQDDPECGYQCTSARRDRRHIPDYSGFIVDEDEALAVGEALVSASERYEVPLVTLAATAYQESRFRRVAIGSGTECGIFQQTTKYFRWETYRDSPVPSRDGITELETRDTNLESAEAECAYLHDLDNAAWQFAMKYHFLHDRYGENWPRYYNAGDDMNGYQSRHYSYAEMLAPALELPAEVAASE